MVTAKGDERDRVRGLDLGADDYIVKPFSATEMLARVRAVLRRAERSIGVTQQENICHDNLRIELARAEVFLDNKDDICSATEYRILLQLARNIGKVVSSEQLLRDVWGDEYMQRQRDFMGEYFKITPEIRTRCPRNPRHIVTRSGVGYTMPAIE